MAELQELARLLSAAHVPGPQMQQATRQLRALEDQAGFSIALIRLLENDSVDPGARLAASIYFKNALKRHWGDDAFPDDERKAIKEGLLPLIFRSPKPVRLQLLATLEELTRPGSAWLAEWPNLLPALSQSVTEAGSDIRLQTQAMEVVHTVFKHFRRGGASSIVRDSRCCSESFGPCHLEVWKHACERLLSPQCPLEQRLSILELLASAMEVFHDLHFQVLPEFFSSNSELYLEGFLALLELRSSGSEAEVEPLRTLQVEICCVLALLGGGFEEERLGTRVQRCLESVCRRALDAGNNSAEDELVAACIRFLQSLTSSTWSQSPLGHKPTLQAVCEHIILPNLQLRHGDLDTFYESPSEWLTLDADGGDSGEALWSSWFGAFAEDRGRRASRSTRCSRASQANFSRERSPQPPGTSRRRLRRRQCSAWMPAFTLCWDSALAPPWMTLARKASARTFSSAMSCQNSRLHIHRPSEHFSEPLASSSFRQCAAPSPCSEWSKFAQPFAGT